ncbi:zinc-dependent alcohol dehydrogenase [Streptomyces asiaticus]|uniref:zinc-dependent alcohol dehydrogenase n=1 Tax=Streptomyces asiaticus TaxID=114695 RepID=UPI003D72F385
MTQVRDLLLTGPGELRSSDTSPPLPALRPDDVVVEVDRVTLCGSDHRLYDGTYGGPRSYPIRFGHEWSGRVVDAGAGARPLLGRLVTGDCSRWCGRCPRCAADRNVCHHIQKFGITVDGFSTRHRTVDSRYLYADDFDLGAGLLALSEFFAVAHHGLCRIPLHEDDDVLVIGAGALGLASRLLLTHEYKVRSVCVMEADPAKAALVAGLFPDAVLRTPPPVGGPGAADYAALTKDARYPVVVECSGSEHGMNTALALALPLGRVLCFGLRSSANLRTDLLVAKSLTLSGSIGGTGSFRGVQAFLADHREEAARLVTHRLPAGRAGEAFAPAPHGTTPRIKTQILFGEETQ